MQLGIETTIRRGIYLHIYPTLVWLMNKILYMNLILFTFEVYLVLINTRDYQKGRGKCADGKRKPKLICDKVCLLKQMLTFPYHLTAKMLIGYFELSDKE